MDHTHILVSDNMSSKVFMLSFCFAMGTAAQKAGGSVVRADNHGWPDYHQP